MITPRHCRKKGENINLSKDNLYINKLEMIRKEFLNFIWHAWDLLPYNFDFKHIDNVKNQCLGGNYWMICKVFSDEIHKWLFKGLNHIEYPNDIDDVIMLLTPAGKFLYSLLFIVRKLSNFY